MSERRRRVFPETFKREAVERAATSGLPIARIAQELGLNETVLRRWIAKDGAEGTAPQRRLMTQAAAPSLADLAAENARLKRELQRAEMERNHPKKSRAHLRSGLPVTFGFVDEHLGTCPVRMMCRVLRISPSGYYAWKGRAESRRSAANRTLLADIRALHQDSAGTYGSPRIHAALRALVAVSADIAWQGRCGEPAFGGWPPCHAGCARRTAGMPVPLPRTLSGSASWRLGRTRSGSPT